MEITKPTTLCTKCNVNPRLGATSKCKSCIKAAAEEDRQSRAAAMVRFEARLQAAEDEEAKKPSPSVQRRELKRLLREFGPRLETIAHSLGIQSDPNKSVMDNFLNHYRSAKGDYDPEVVFRDIGRVVAATIERSISIAFSKKISKKTGMH